MLSPKYERRSKDPLFNPRGRSDTAGPNLPYDVNCHPTGFRKGLVLILGVRDTWAPSVNGRLVLKSGERAGE
jgi:hypothetical protein